ncbi:MAG: hypothetical protein KAX78_07180, partial [Phycisphaerae bacterium]|nr:hypothetical protein [Phycisphaerae bacterium]
FATRPGERIYRILPIGPDLITISRLDEHWEVGYEVTDADEIHAHLTGWFGGGGRFRRVRSPAGEDADQPD